MTAGAMSDDPAAQWKRAAANAAAAEVADGMVVGLGSGSTAEFFLQELAARVRQGLRVTGVPTSERTAGLAAALGIPLLALNDAPPLDMSVDGADEVVVPTLALIKGRGGALLREKLVAASSRRRLIIVDSSKLVSQLGAEHPLPVEVIPFGWVQTAQRLAAMGCQPARRLAPGSAPDDAQPFVTDNGDYILDCRTGAIDQPASLAHAIKALAGVVDHGLFVSMTERVIVAGPDGVRTFDQEF